MNQNPETPFLSLKGLAKSFGRHRVLKDLSLTINEGEYLTLLGPSGCGKTTSLRMIAGFISPDSGRILLDGVDIVDLPPERRPVNMVFQDYALFPHLTVRQNVEYGLKVHGIEPSERARRVTEMLELVQLEGMPESYPRFLSGGQQQRVALARALILRPRLLLLDEPLGALDAKLREQMQIVLKDLQRALKIAFIHVTHDQTEAMALSDRIVVMRDGEIMQIDTPGELYRSPANSFVADFLGNTSLLRGVCESQREGRARIRLADGSLVEGQTRLAFSAGEAIILSVRPHSVVLTRDAPDATSANGFRLRVTSLVYRGEQWLVVGERAGLRLLALVSEKAASGLGLAPGDEHYFSWSVNDGWLMKA